MDLSQKLALHRHVKNDSINSKKQLLMSHFNPFDNRKNGLTLEQAIAIENEDLALVKQALEDWHVEGKVSAEPIDKPLQGNEGRVLSIAFSPDGKRLVSGGHDGILRLWDVKSGQAIGGPLLGHKGAVNSVAFSLDGQRLASGSEDMTLRLWDAKSGQPIGSPLQGHAGAVHCVVFSPDGQRLVSGSSDKSLRLWDAKSGKSILTPLQGHDGSVRSVAFSRDGQRLVSVGLDMTLRVWHVRTAQPIGAPLPGTQGKVTSTAFSPDGRRLVSGSEDRTLRLWDAESGQPIGAPLQGHAGAVHCVSFSPDGQRLVSGSEDMTLRLWDAESGQPIGSPLQGHAGAVHCVAFSSDGQRLVSGSSDKNLRLWNVKTGEPQRNWVMSRLMRRYFAVFLSPYFLDETKGPGAKTKLVKRSTSLRSWFSTWSHRPDDHEAADAGQKAFASLLAQTEPTALQAIRSRIEHNIATYSKHLEAESSPSQPVRETAFENYLRGMIVNQLISARRTDARRAGILAGAYEVEGELEADTRQPPGDDEGNSNEKPGEDGSDPEEIEAGATDCNVGPTVAAGTSSNVGDGGEEGEEPEEGAGGQSVWIDGGVSSDVLSREFLRAYEACIKTLSPKAQEIMLATLDMGKGEHFDSDASVIQKVFGVNAESFRKTRQRGFKAALKCLESKGFGPDYLSSVGS
ncbi:WD40 repeat domain-containing protein [Paucibacter sp. DJ2R-2]|uniref:WD40 repeat domain-containing protein n=1 Tax=Paucibacter sp. DJ2R-2 TaxID=2893558 RepID=UPI0021E37F8B|nr:WD40 repeat domain-containing protein [Paucibacter sp. DJ2R-2]MCV2439273.1 WD40 repeat domain-containing protein [Paucibacter sp. DJ2R-2]